jgi:Ca2+-binding EF-hand superfamily protein
MMKLLVGAAVAALATTPVLAQTAPPTPPGVAQGTGPAMPMPRMQPMPPMVPMPRMRGMERMHMMMSGGAMTRDEMLRHVRELFARLDTNKDGYVSRDEIEALHAKFANTGAEMHKRIEEHGMPMGNRAAMFDRLDTNHDGVISRQEFMAAKPVVHREERVMVMRDGGTPAEPGMDGMEHRKMEFRFRTMAPLHGMGVGMGGMGMHLFEMADTNHDGRVSLQEAEALAMQHFDRADLNHDGRITPDEQRQAHELMRREHHPS